MSAWSKTFTDKGDFAALHAAQRYLSDRGIRRASGMPMVGARLSAWKQKIGRHWSQRWERRI